MGFSDLEKRYPGTSFPTPDIYVLRCTPNPHVWLSIYSMKHVCAVYARAKGFLVCHFHFSKHITVAH